MVSETVTVTQKVDFTTEFRKMVTDLKRNADFGRQYA